MGGGFPGGMSFNMGGPGGGMGGIDPNEIFKMFFSQQMEDDGGFGSFMNSSGGRGGRGQGGMGGGMPFMFNMGGGGGGTIFEGSGLTS